MDHYDCSIITFLLKKWSLEKLVWYTELLSSMLSFTWSLYIWQRHCIKGEKRKNSHNNNSFFSFPTFLVLVMFQRLRGSRCKRRAGDSHHSNRVVRKEKCRWVPVWPRPGKELICPLRSHGPLLAPLGETRQIRKLRWEPWSTSHPGVPVSTPVSSASPRCSLEQHSAHRACLGYPSLLRAPGPAAGRADRPSPLTQRASARTCPKEQGHAAEPRCGCSGFQRNGCAKEGWDGWIWYSKARALKDRAHCSAWPEDLPPHNMETIHHWESLSCSFSFFHPIPALLK